MTGLRCSLPKAGTNNDGFVKSPDAWAVSSSGGYYLPCLAGFFLLLIFLISFLGGCALYPLESIPVTDYRLSPVETLGTIDLKDNRKTFMKAVAQVVVNTEEGRYPLKLAILAAKPASLRMEAIPIIGLPNFFLSIHNGTMKVYLPQNGEYYVGPATINNLKSFFPIQLAVPDLVALLMGCRPTISSEQTILKGSAEGRSYRVDILSKNNQPLQSLWIDPENLNLTRLDKFGKNGDKLLTVYFDEYFQDNDLSMPNRVRFQMPGVEERTISIRYDGATFTPLTDETDQIFDLTVPEGVRTITLK